MQEFARQVRLLLDVLPEVAKEDCFALHGGTAINLFVLNMPRLSVDIDLTYVYVHDRHASLVEINSALQRIEARITGLRSSIRTSHKDQTCKLLVEEQGVLVKIEVNIIGRGLIDEAYKKMPLCESAQEQFDAFCAISVVSTAQLYGGKLCAAVDRQHPRDLFDVRLLLQEKAYSAEIKRGFIYALASSNRPVHELLDPNLIDQRTTYDNQFVGMSQVPFSYENFKQTRLDLITTLRRSLIQEDKHFLVSLIKLQPDWSVYDFQRFPSVKWKLMNLQAFKDTRPDDYQQQIVLLERLFNE